MTTSSETFDGFRAEIAKLKSRCLSVSDLRNGISLEFVHDGLRLGAFEVFAGPDVGLLAMHKDGESTIGTPSELLAKIKTELEMWQFID